MDLTCDALVGFAAGALDAVLVLLEEAWPGVSISDRPARTEVDQDRGSHSGDCSCGDRGGIGSPRNRDHGVWSYPRRFSSRT